MNHLSPVAKLFKITDANGFGVGYIRGNSVESVRGLFSVGLSEEIHLDFFTFTEITNLKEWVIG